MGCLVVVVFAMHLLGKWEIGIVQQLEFIAYDARVQLTTRSGQDTRIVIIDVDEKTLRELGQWPWPRERLGQLVENLFDQYDISVFGLDMVFAEHDQRSGKDRILERAASVTDAELQQELVDLAESLDGDSKFAAALSGRNVVMGYYFNTDEDLTHSVGLLPEPVLK